MKFYNISALYQNYFKHRVCPTRLAEYIGTVKMRAYFSNKRVQLISVVVDSVAGEND